MDPSTLSSKTRILIIDDSQQLLEALKMVLETGDHEVIIKTSTEDVFDFVQHTKIDILLIDVLLEGVNGKHICKELKSNLLTSYFPIILMSATPEYMVDFKECDADGILEKPFDINFLVAKINSLTKANMQNL